MQTEVYWVVGSNENVGKTTVASSLIECLNQTGHATIGFKPYSAGKFIDLIDTLAAPEAVEAGIIVGLDGVQLCASSPLMSKSDLELTQPILFVCYPNYAYPMIVRAGSQYSGAVEYWRGRGSTDILKPDSGYFESSMSERFVGFANARLTDLSFLDAPKLDNGHIDRCLNKLLLEKSPKTVVFEGAGKWLPVWSTEYVVKHVLYIHMNKIHFFKGVNLTMSANGDRLVAVEKLLDYLKNFRPNIVRLPFARSQHRRSVAHEAIKSLLEL